MLRSFRAEHLKKAKWLLTRDLELAQERQNQIRHRPRKKRSIWSKIKSKLFGR
ncbi:hypothetical protein MNB_SV-6-101 [hydrothermal vent metagenome]|uniref:Uncharacterized protein n=1 Tax=hydrothermal vent metagenome TaxID=652676 RepID=A0A1W1BKM7_9ZZZZ